MAYFTVLIVLLCMLLSPLSGACVYKGRIYTKDQKWQDGCYFNCICEDDLTGQYTCTLRCAIYPSLPRQCRLARDPNDKCCYAPVCNWNSTQPTQHVQPIIQLNIS